MAKFKVYVVRNYTAHHTHIREVEANSREDAMHKVEDDLEDDVFDPTDDYTDSNQEYGYDRAGTWTVERAENA